MNKSKKELRERILTLLRNQEENKRLAKSLVIMDKLFMLQTFKESNTVLFYASFDGEVDTIEMIKRAKILGKTVGLPKAIQERKKILPLRVDDLDNDIEQGAYGISEPKDRGTNRLDIESLDMVIVPGVAFDRQNNRLGRGEGYYDRFFETVPSHLHTVGLAFDFQIVDTFPFLEKHDMPVSLVLTN